MYFEREWSLESRLVTFETLAEPSLQFGITRLPQFIAHMNPFGRDRTVAKLQRSESVGSLSQIVNPAALFFFFRVPCIKDDAVAALQWRFEAQSNALPIQPGNLAQVHSALLAESRMNKF